MNDLEKISTGTEGLYSVIDDYGGDKNPQSFNQSMVNIKNYILSSMPKKHIKGFEARFSEMESKTWLKELEGVITPENFISSLTKGKLTKKQIDIFSNFYPKFLDQLQMTLLEGLQNKQIPFSSNIRRFLELRKDQSLSCLLYTSPSPRD